MPLLRPPAPDPSLDHLDGGVGVLTRDGEFFGHVATSRGKFWSPSAPFRWQWWVWYLVVWADGTRERPAEDYPPYWAVQEMKDGSLQIYGERGGDYEFAWLAPDEAASVRDQLGIADEDF